MQNNIRSLIICVIVLRRNTIVTENKYLIHTCYNQVVIKYVGNIYIKGASRHKAYNQHRKLCWACQLKLYLNKLNTFVKCAKYEVCSHAGRDGTGRDGTGRDGTGRDGTGRDGTGRDGTGRDGTGRDGTGRDGTGRDGTGRDGTGRGTGRDGTGRDGTGRDGTGRDGTGRDGTGRDGTGRDVLRGVPCQFQSGAISGFSKEE